MGVGEVSRLLDSMCWQKVHQGDAVRVAPIDYNALMLDELEQIEKFSPNCKDEIKMSQLLYSTLFVEKQYRKIVGIDCPVEYFDEGFGGNLFSRRILESGYDN